MPSLLLVLTLIGFHLDTSVAYASDFSKDDLKVLATSIAIAHGLNAQKFVSVIDCESGFNADAVGDHGTSFGIAQLHHPERDWGITKEQAKEPLRAMEIMATAWDKKEMRRWSCYKR